MSYGMIHRWNAAARSFPKVACLKFVNGIIWSRLVSSGLVLSDLGLNESPIHNIPTQYLLVPFDGFGVAGCPPFDEHLDTCLLHLGRRELALPNQLRDHVTVGAVGLYFEVQLAVQERDQPLPRVHVSYVDPAGWRCGCGCGCGCGFGFGFGFGRGLLLRMLPRKPRRPWYTCVCAYVRDNSQIGLFRV